MTANTFNAAALKTPAGVEELMCSSRNAREWNTHADAVKSANGGDYPDFWFQTVIMSGLAAQTQKKFTP